MDNWIKTTESFPTKYGQYLTARVVNTINGERMIYSVLTFEPQRQLFFYDLKNMRPEPSILAWQSITELNIEAQLV